MTLPSFFIQKATRNLNLRDYSFISRPIAVCPRDITCPYDRQYILRMMVRSPKTNGLVIPPELAWLAPTIYHADNIQRANNLNNEFVYITVRHGVVTSETDDSWHADGFSLRFPHVPEQNYCWANRESTEWQEKPFSLPDGFDGLKHNLHSYLAKHADEAQTRQCEDKVLYLFDPYFVHRRPRLSNNTIRTFFRISFIPIEIEDDTCMRNPLLPEIKYGRKDIREKLVDFS